MLRHLGRQLLTVHTLSGPQALSIDCSLARPRTMAMAIPGDRHKTLASLLLLVGSGKGLFKSKDCILLYRTHVMSNEVFFHSNKVV